MARLYSEDFKRDAVGMAQTSGLTRLQLASDLGVGLSTLGKWIRHYGKTWASDDEEGSGFDAAALARENERLRKELALVREEREILKKATQFFAEISK